jgi:hypothetical protein
METDDFTLRMLPDSHCLLRRSSEKWEREFNSLQEALACAAELPGGRDAQMSVLDEKGGHLVRVFL